VNKENKQQLFKIKLKDLNLTSGEDKVSIGELEIECPADQYVKLYDILSQITK
jgi:hypothetical protein